MSDERVYEGVALRHYEGWSICDPTDHSENAAFHGVDPFAGLDGENVKVTVEVRRHQ